MHAHTHAQAQPAQLPDLASWPVIHQGGQGTLRGVTLLRRKIRGNSTQYRSVLHFTSTGRGPTLGQQSQFISTAGQYTPVLWEKFEIWT